MTVASDFVELLSDDNDIPDKLTGGIYSIEDTGYMGVSINSTPAAFSGPLLLPCAVVKARSQVATSEIRDPNTKATSFNQAIEIWLYEQNSTETIEEAAALIYNLLHESKPVDDRWCYWMQTTEGQEARELGGALFSKMEFQLKGIKSSSS